MRGVQALGQLRRRPGRAHDQSRRLRQRPRPRRSPPPRFARGGRLLIYFYTGQVGFCRGTICRASSAPVNRAPTDPAPLDGLSIALRSHRNMTHTQTLASPNAVSPLNGEDALHDLHALSDEQILEIEPEVPASSSAPIVPKLSASSAVGAQHAAPLLGAMQDAVAQAFRPEGVPAQEQTTQRQEKSLTPEGVSYNESESAKAPPPKWLADRMNDPWNGEEARTFWQGIQQEREEAAAYRGVFAKPDDARAAADRSRQLEQIDGLYFGSAGKSPEEAAAAREQLAQTLLQQDPAAFREMVFAGLRALERTNVAAAGIYPDPVGRPPSSASDNVPPPTDAGQKPAAAQ